MGIIHCPRCNLAIIRYEDWEIREQGPEDVVRAEFYRSLVMGWPDPKMGDKMNCPKCRADYGFVLIESWKRERLSLVGEWDE